MIVLVQNHLQTYIATKVYNQSEVSLALEPIEFGGTNDISQIYQTTGLFFLVFLLINYLLAKFLHRRQWEQQKSIENIEMLKKH
ncbi:hypothetical protein F7734_28260 [Scytonema sp. UIC 10036]|uniref:hypothetical protein n=1 Tax=Scytonema sp. UIC 10036 TaxID=2304196 RepID=UPI0012DADE47|nr:hypothetical protein [Scytonema sp. UIC 10036]MUG96030.1 hypothetical protein [Scytonema sp. UIC 10036]